MKTTLKTARNQSPIIEVKTKDGRPLLLCIDDKGNIYRAFKTFNKHEEPLIVPEYDVELNPKTEMLIAGYEASYSTQSPQSELMRKTEIQRMLYWGAGYVNYRLNDNPLHELDANRYYDVLASFENYNRANQFQTKCSTLSKELGQIVSFIASQPKMPKSKEAILKHIEKLKIKAEKQRLAELQKLLKSAIGSYLYVSKNWSSGKHFRKGKDSFGFSTEKTNHKTCMLVTKENYKNLVQIIEKL